MGTLVPKLTSRLTGTYVKSLEAPLPFKKKRANMFRTFMEPSYFAPHMKLDGVGAVDNGPSTNKLHHFVQKRKKKKKKVTCDM